MGETLVVLNQPVGMLKVGNTFITDANWVEHNDLTMQICYSHLAGIHLFSKIPAEVFRYSLSRLRSREGKIQRRGNSKRGVFANLEGVWLGSEKVLDLKSDVVDITELLIKYEEYWEKQNA